MADLKTAEAIKNIADASPDEKEARKKLKELENEAWEDFLDMTITRISTKRAGTCSPIADGFQRPGNG